jgi:hypothetical protein
MHQHNGKAPLERITKTSDRVNACHNHLVNTAGFQQGGQAWLYCPTWTRGKLSRLQPSQEGSYKVVTWINDVIYRIMRHLRTKMMVVPVNRLVSYLGATWNEQPWESSVTWPKLGERAYDFNATCWLTDSLWTPHLCWWLKTTGHPQKVSKMTSHV